MTKQWAALAAGTLLAFAAAAGEIIGNTYISEKQGYIEVQSPDGKWQIQDREGQGTQLASLTLKDPISGSRPTMLFFAIPKAAGVTVDQVVGWSRETMAQNGMELGAIEPLRFGGKPVVVFGGSLTKGNIKVLQRSYMLEGPKSFFMVSATAQAAAFDAAKPLFDEVIEKLKY